MALLYMTLAAALPRQCQPFSFTTTLDVEVLP
jgi:hypothetical protein